jgi:hypothetical protein
MRASHKVSRREGRIELLANALRAALEPVTAELRLVDAGDFIAFIHDEKFANIQDIVNSSVELFFKRGALSFGWGAEYELGMARPRSFSTWSFAAHPYGSFSNLFCAPCKRT